MNKHGIQKILLFVVTSMILVLGSGAVSAEEMSLAADEALPADEVLPADEMLPTDEALPADEVLAADEAPADDEPQPAEATGAVAVKTVETPDFSMDYCQFGHGDRVLAILPGLSIQNVLDSADAVAEGYQLLAEDFTIYLFERRSDLPSSYTVSDMTDDTAAAFQALGLEQVNIYGVSYGGMAAMEMAIRYPDLVDKIILASTSADLTDEEFQAVSDWIDLAEAGDAEALYLAFGEALYPADLFEESRELLIDAAKTVTPEDLERFIILGKGMKGFSVAEDLDQIHCPVLVLGDKQDRILGPTALENLALLLKDDPDCELYLYDGYGHAVYDLAPDFKERMFEFLMKGEE